MFSEVVRKKVVLGLNVYILNKDLVSARLWVGFKNLSTERDAVLWNTTVFVYIQMGNMMPRFRRIGK